MRIVPVILCGGSGTRLWPLRRPKRPTPFLPLLGKQTLFEATLARCAVGELFAPPLLVTGEAQLALVEGELGGSEIAGIIVEPGAKSKAAAIALAAHRLPADAVMLVCPCDHHIPDTAAFLATARKAAALAGEGWLVAFGIAPGRAETGYGYIQRGEVLPGGAKIARFVEKPDRATAEAFLADGSYCWNGGIFAFRAGTFLEELAAHRPALAEAVREAVVAGRGEGARFRPDAALFGRIDAESVDYAVMEETSHAAMVDAVMGWSDIGNWQALRDASEGDAQRNVVRGPAELLDCNNMMVESDGPRVSVVWLDEENEKKNNNEEQKTNGKGAASVGKLTGAKGN